MNRFGKIAVALAGVLLAGVGLRADDTLVAASDNPYMAIAARNVFNLNPPVAVTPDQPTPAVKITPNGIMSIFGNLQVLFKTSGGPAGNKDQSYILSAGQRQDDIEVLQIDEKKGMVKFDNHGITQDLAIANGAASGGSAIVASSFPLPANNAANNGFAGRGNGRFGNSGGGPRGRNNDSMAGGAGGNGNPDANDTSNLRNIPTRNYQPAANGTPMTPEEQVIMIEAQRSYYQAQGSPIAKILPPTSMTPAANGEDNSGEETPGAPAP